MTRDKVSTTLTMTISFVSGALFAIGLIVAQMVNPEKVISFLRIVENWDPSLGLVMGGGIAVAMPVFLYVKRRIRQGKSALNGDEIALPTATKITPQLVIGSIMFGVGWGLVGFCPAPAIVGALAGYADAMIFMVALATGMFIHEYCMTK